MLCTGTSLFWVIAEVSSWLWCLVGKAGEGVVLGVGDDPTRLGKGEWRGEEMILLTLLHLLRDAWRWRTLIMASFSAS